MSSGHHEQFSDHLTPRLHQVLKGIRKESASIKPARIRRPITIQIMTGIKDVLLRNPQDYHNIMMWAACCLAFFGFLRSSEFTTPSQSEFDPEVHLSVQDVSVDDKKNPQRLKVVIKQSKTDPFRQGVSVFLGRTDSAICPVKAILPYLVVRGCQQGPLFIMKDGRKLTRQLFSTSLDVILEKLHLEGGHYNTHSFRIGAATSAREAGMEDSHIMMLGRWRSSAYRSYIRTTPETLASLSRTLASGASTPSTDWHMTFIHATQ